MIGNRSFGDTEERVSKLVSAYIRGHLHQGVQPCLKHFPGHGDTSVDSHLALPKVDTLLEMLEDREFKPFQKGFRAKCNFLMSAHVVVKSIDPEVPATLSSKILRQIVRQKMGFTGLIISDDLEMQAITDHFGAEDTPRLALQAGCDLLLYRSEKAARAAHESLCKALENGKLAPELVLECCARIQALKATALAEVRLVSVADVGEVADHSTSGVGRALR